MATTATTVMQTKYGRVDAGPAPFLVLFWRAGQVIWGEEPGHTRFTTEEAADEWARTMMKANPEEYSHYEVAQVVSFLR